MDMKRRLEVMKEIEAANKKHLEEWKAAMQSDGLHNFYFTFGTDTHYPYGYDDYVLIRCEDAEQACKLFDAVHKPRHEGVMNCAFMYGEEEWDYVVKKQYEDRAPVETIIISRTGSR